MLENTNKIHSELIKTSYKIKPKFNCKICSGIGEIKWYCDGSFTITSDNKYKIAPQQTICQCIAKQIFNKSGIKQISLENLELKKENSRIVEVLL